MIPRNVAWQAQEQAARSAWACTGVLVYAAIQRPSRVAALVLYRIPAIWEARRARAGALR